MCLHAEVLVSDNLQNDVTARRRGNLIFWGLLCDFVSRNDNLLVAFRLVDRPVPRKPRLLGGVKGHNQNDVSVPGSHRPMGGELHIRFIRCHSFCS